MLYEICESEKKLCSYRTSEQNENENESKPEWAINIIKNELIIKYVFAE